MGLTVGMKLPHKVPEHDRDQSDRGATQVWETHTVKNFGFRVRFYLAMDEKFIFYEPQFSYLGIGTVCENYSLSSMI